jgi:hypothetical protein
MDNQEKAALIDNLRIPDNPSPEASIVPVEESSSWSEMKLLEYGRIIEHRKQWSDWLLVLVCYITIMDFVVLLLLGSGAIQFEESITVPTFIGGTLLEVFGLSYIVVQFLFNKDGKKPTS